jgi:hypothetical protein
VAAGGGGEYRERGVFNAVAAHVREVEALGKDLFVVGKTLGLTAGMAEWSECPELGPIGDCWVLASRPRRSCWCCSPTPGRGP